MLPFHRIYSWLFKSFRISGETELLEYLIKEGHARVMIIKRSWIFALYTLWMPVIIIILSAISIWIALVSIEIEFIRNTIIGGNVIMACILFFSSINYIRHFYDIGSGAIIWEDLEELKEKLHLGDTYFINFFNASLTNQFLLILTIIIEIVLVILYQNNLGNHYWILATDTLVMIIEILFLKSYRKKMIDLEMDYNVVVPGKIYFINQSGILSSTQTIESDKIKTVRSLFPSKLASFFDYGTVDILTEGDTQAMMGTMSMYYVTDPDGVVANIQSLLDTPEDEERQKEKTLVKPENISDHPKKITYEISAKEHAFDTRNKIRDVLR